MSLSQVIPGGPGEYRPALQSLAAETVVRRSSFSSCGAVQREEYCSSADGYGF